MSPLVNIFLDSGMTELLLKKFRTSSTSQREFYINNSKSNVKIFDLFEEIENYGFNSFSKEED